MERAPTGSGERVFGLHKSLHERWHPAVQLPSPRSSDPGHRGIKVTDSLILEQTSALVCWLGLSSLPLLPRVDFLLSQHQSQGSHPPLDKGCALSQTALPPTPKCSSSAEGLRERKAEAVHFAPQLPGFQCPGSTSGACFSEACTAFPVTLGAAQDPADKNWC